VNIPLCALLDHTLTCHQDTGSGLRAIDSIAERPGFEGVYGPLYRLFNVASEEYNLAVEHTAGNRYGSFRRFPEGSSHHCSLFHIVVDSDQTAQRVLDLMMKERTGRVTFMPLNRLKPKNPTMPNMAEAFPLISKINFDDRYVAAFQQVFGKTCVCKDLTIGAAYVKSHGINIITTDGDKVDRKGALTGGYHDVRRSRIEAIKNVTEWRTRHEEESRKSKEVKAGILRLEQEITRSNGNVQVNSTQLARLKTTMDSLLNECKSLDSEAESLRERVTALEGAVEDIDTELADLGVKGDALKTEKRSPMARGLSSDEEESLTTLSEEVDRLKTQLMELGKEKAEVKASTHLAEYSSDKTSFRSLVRKECSRSISRRIFGVERRTSALRSTGWGRTGRATLLLARS
jgi:structural maintenance of chromosome 3 (chondroitin sulfate proteoglycan 6)